MAEACCGPAAPPADGGVPASSAGSFWAITEVRFALVAGALLAGGLISAAANATVASEVLFAGAIAVGGWTFVPDALRGLAKGRLGVGTLMTIAAIGAVILGELGEAASLAFLFSISEALEGWALARTRSGRCCCVGCHQSAALPEPVENGSQSARASSSNAAATVSLGRASAPSS